MLYLLYMLQKTNTERFHHITLNKYSMVHSSNQYLWCDVISVVFFFFSLCVCLCLTSQDIQRHECTTYYSNLSPVCVQVKGKLVPTKNTLKDACVVWFLWYNLKPYNRGIPVNYSWSLTTLLLINKQRKIQKCIF